MNVLINTASLKNPDTHLDADRVVYTLNSELGLSDNTSIAVAYSGGMDSSVLLHILNEHKDKFGWQVRAIHINHGLHPEAELWQQHCQKICHGWGIPLMVARVQVDRKDKDGLEAAARKVRYAKLADLLDRDEVLLTGHHRDDQAETVLLHLMRASGVSGLSGMSRESRLDKNRLLRPLLEYGRSELAVYAEESGITWVEDASNASHVFARNYLRHSVLPEIEHRWPAASRNIARSAQWLGEASAILKELAQADLVKAIGSKPNQLNLSMLENLSEARLKNALRFWVERCGLPSIPQSVMKTLLNCVLHESKSGHALVAWPGVEVHRYGSEIYCMKSPPALSSDWSTRWDLAKPLDLPLLNCSLDTVQAFGAGLSRERIGQKPVLIRLRQGGERCRLPGRRHHKKLKNLLQEKRLPPWQRDRIPLLYVGKQLAAVGDHWVCEPFVAQKDEPGLVIKMTTYSV